MVQEKQTKTINVTLQDDSILRPWTTNLRTEQRLHDETVKLDRMIAQTSPQKIAGFRGSSSLEKLPELIEFQNSLSMSLKSRNNNYKTLAPISIHSKKFSDDIKKEISFRDAPIEVTFAHDVKMGNEKSSVRPNSSLQRDLSDINTINKIQRLIRLDNKNSAMKRKKILNPLASIQYERPTNTLVQGMPGFKTLKFKMSSHN